MDSRLIRLALACALATILIATQTGPAAAGTVAVSVPTWESDYDWSHGHGYAGWRTATTAADPAAYGFAAGLADLPGLWLWPTGGREYRPGTAEWVYDAPGTTRIADATIDASYDEKLFAHHCLGVSLNTASEQRAYSAYCKPPQGGPKHVLFDVSDPSSVPLSKEARLTIEMPPCHNPADKPCSKYIPQLDPAVNGPFARSTHVHLVLVDDDQPTATASGPLRDGVNGYLNGRRSYPVTLSASDPGAGVRTLGLVGPDGSHVVGNDVTCDPTHNTPELGSRLCPERSAITRSVDVSNMPEGAAWFHADAQDLAANGGAEDPWRVLVDRTAPPPPHDFEVDLDTETDTANINWIADDDPALADGNPGSGLTTWTYRFYHPRLGWSDWHTGTDSVEVPQSLEGDEIKVEVRSIDAVGNESDLAMATLRIPVEDNEDSFQSLDSGQPEPAGADVPDPADPQAGAATANTSTRTMTLQFQALSLSERRDAALARVRRDCATGLAKVHCYDAVNAACHVGGICTAAKQIACSQVGLYCPVADAAKVSLVAQYQPTFRMDKSDRFWPVSFSTALKERWAGRSVCYVRDDNCLASGYDDVRHLINNMDHQVDGLKLDYPAHWDDLNGQFHSMTDALGLPRIDTNMANTDPRWDAVYNSARIYWYRGGSFGSNTGTAKSLQYWTFLTYNYLPSSFGIQDHHEGDIEMVAVVLDANDQPVWLFESRHGTNLKKEARRFQWGGGAFQKFDTHPIVFSAHGSHAMYESCGKHDRSNLPDDHIGCEATGLLNFTYLGTKRISLGRSSWGCWGGKLGNSSSTLDGGGSPPAAPLWQEATFHGDPTPCADGSPASASAASAKRHSGRRAHAAAQPVQDPLVQEFARCEDWYQAPTQPGTTVVACDQAQLDHYIASGLTDPGPGGAAVVGPDGRSNDVPSVYSSEDPRGLPSVRVSGSGSSAGVYAATLGVDGTLRTATFPATTLPQGTALHVQWNGATAQLVSPGGHVIATAVVTTRHGSRFAVLPTPRALKARRVGRQVTVSWLGAAATSYSVSSGTSPAGAGAHLLKSIKRGAAGRRRVVVRAHKGDRWIGLRAIKGSTTSRMVTAQVR